MLLSVVFTLIALLLDSAVAVAQPLRQASFELRNEIKVKVPEGAQRLRVWVALPQDDPSQQVRDLKIEAPYAYRIERDSEGSRVLYLEAANPKDKELTIVETFGLTRREIREQVDAALAPRERRSTRPNSSHLGISYAVFCLKKKKTTA